MSKNLTPALKKLLLSAGCEFFRHGKGSHDIWVNPATGMKFPVQHRILSRHTANGVLKQASQPKQF